MVHEGPLSWKVNKDKTIGLFWLIVSLLLFSWKVTTTYTASFYFLSELYTLLLEDILFLLQKQDERLILKCHSKNLSGTADTKHIFSPIIKLNTVLVRSVATGQLPHKLWGFITRIRYEIIQAPSIEGRVIFINKPLFCQTTSPSLFFRCRKTEPKSTS